MNEEAKKNQLEMFRSTAVSSQGQDSAYKSIEAQKNEQQKTVKSKAKEESQESNVDPLLQTFKESSKEEIKPKLPANELSVNELPVNIVKHKNGIKAGVATLCEAEVKRIVWRHTAPVGVTLKDVLEPIYFCNVVKKMREFSKIEIIAEDGSWYAELLIVSVMTASAKLQVLNYVELITVSRQFFENDIHKIEWMGAEGKFTVIRKADSTRILGGFSNIIDAQRWLIDHEKALLA